MLLALDTTMDILQLALIGAGGMGEVSWGNAKPLHLPGESLITQRFNIGGGLNSLLEFA